MSYSPIPRFPSPVRGLPSLASLLALIFLPSCSDIVLVTRTSAGLEVAGEEAPVPTHVNFGFRRRELIYAGKDAPKDKSMFGRIDSETTWSEGAAIRETVATGRAAEMIADPNGTHDEMEDETEHSQPLVFASRTRLGFGINLGGADDDAIPSGYLGYSRRVATRIKTAKILDGVAPDLPTVVADISVHTSSLLGGEKAPAGNLSTAATLSDGPTGGARIRQFFAVGRGADKVLRAKAASASVETPAEAAKKTSGANIAEVLNQKMLQRSNQ